MCRVSRASDTAQWVLQQWRGEIATLLSWSGNVPFHGWSWMHMYIRPSSCNGFTATPNKRFSRQVKSTDGLPLQLWKNFEEFCPKTRMAAKGLGAESQTFYAQKASKVSWFWVWTLNSMSRLRNCSGKSCMKSLVTLATVYMVTMRKLKRCFQEKMIARMLWAFAQWTWVLYRVASWYGCHKWTETFSS